MKFYTFKKKLLLKIYRKLDANNFSPYNWKNELESPGDRALKVSKNIRGADRLPAIIINGVMVRSGTNYIGELLGLHPNFCSYPGKIWEVPFLGASPHLIEFQKNFLNGYNYNRARLGETDFLPLFGSAFIAYLYSFVPEGQQMLLKVPSVKYLWNFRHIFPNEKLIVLQRDGRDVVASVMNSWGKYNEFANICTQWAKSQDLILKFQKSPTADDVCFVKYEESVAKPQLLVQRIFKKVNIDDASYPYAQVDKIPLKGSSGVKVEGKLTWKDVEKPKTFKSIGRWTKWTDREKKIFKKICGETLIRSGYAENMEW